MGKSSQAKLSRRDRQPPAEPVDAHAPGPSAASPSPTLRVRPETLAALALALVYFAFMNGHLTSMDGLMMLRQSYALVFDHSVSLRMPVWTWAPEPRWNSPYGIGLSLLYVPGVWIAAGLHSLVPMSLERPARLNPFYLQEVYQDPLFTVGVAWVHVAVAAVGAWLVARLTQMLGGSRRASLWAMMFYGLGSSAFVYSRGDFAQPLEALCWLGAVLLALRFRRDGARTALVGCGAVVAYAILTRPLEGSLLVPAVVALLLPRAPWRSWRLSSLLPVLAPVLGAMAGVAGTLLVNWARYGDPFISGYGEKQRWFPPDFERWAGVLVSPGRGVLWEFPALLLAPLGAAALMRSGRRYETAVLLALCAMIFVMTASWHMWWGGWCWGLRLFIPATPLLAVMAGIGVEQLGDRTRRWLPGLLLAAGIFWCVPGLVTDIQAGYGEMADGAAKSWQLEAYPPIGAWQFLKRGIGATATDGTAVDILWVRMMRTQGPWPLLVPVVLLGLAGFVARRSLRQLEHEEREAAAPRLPESAGS